MHCLLAVVLDDEAKANEAKQALLQLEAEGAVIIHGYALVAKHSDETVTVNYEDEHRPFFAFAGKSRTEGDPSGEAAALGHAAADVKSASIPTSWDNSRICKVIDDVKKVMLPNRVALVADIEEEWEIAVDTRMESRGGIVFRWTLEE